MKIEEQIITNVSNMSELRLLDFVLNNPEYIFESHYSEIRDAIHKRYDKLTGDLDGN